MRLIVHSSTRNRLGRMVNNAPDWNPEYGATGAVKFPSKLLLQTFRITHPEYSVAIFSRRRVVCRSSSL